MIDLIEVTAVQVNRRSFLRRVTAALFALLAGLAAGTPRPAVAGGCSGPYGSGRCSGCNCSSHRCACGCGGCCQYEYCCCGGYTACWSSAGHTCCDCRCRSGSFTWYCYCHTGF
jgi:hypothetical protein